MKASRRDMMNGWSSRLNMHTSLTTFLVNSGLLSTSGMRFSATCKIPLKLCMQLQKLQRLAYCSRGCCWEESGTRVFGCWADFRLCVTSDYLEGSPFIPVLPLGYPKHCRLWRRYHHLSGAAADTCPQPVRGKQTWLQAGDSQLCPLHTYQRVHRHKRDKLQQLSSHRKGDQAVSERH